METDNGVGGTNRFVYARLFSDGSVEYHPRGSQDIKKDRVSKGQVSEEEFNAVMETLVRADIKALPKYFATTYTPKDFYWTLDFRILRGPESQFIKVVNFYPPMAKQNRKPYPEALIRLVCTAWRIRESFTKEQADLSGNCSGFV